MDLAHVAELWGSVKAEADCHEEGQAGLDEQIFCFVLHQWLVHSNKGPSGRQPEVVDLASEMEDLTL